MRLARADHQGGTPCRTLHGRRAADDDREHRSRPVTADAGPNLAAALPSSLAANPDLDTWIRVDAAGTVTVFTGKVELGQGIVSAVARIGAEELDLAIDQVRVETADTVHGLNEGTTAGS